MKKTFSKIRNKSSKEKKNNEQEGANEQLNTVGTQEINGSIKKKPLNRKNDNVYVYNVDLDAAKIRKEKPRNNSSPSRSTETFEAFTTTTSESDFERKNKTNKKNGRQSTKNVKKYRDAIPEVCITLPQDGKPKVRLVGTSSPVTRRLAPKQVEFASLDAVYGTASEASSDEGTDEKVFTKHNPQVYRVEGQVQNVLPQVPKNSPGVTGRQDLTSGHQENKSGQKPYNTQNSLSPEERKVNESDKSGGSKNQPSLAMPVFAVNIKTSKECISQEPSNNKDTMNTQSPSSQLFKLKQHLLGIPSGVGNHHGQQNRGQNQDSKDQTDTTDDHHSDTMDRKNDNNGNRNNGRKFEDEELNARKEKTDGENLRDAIEQFLKTNNLNNATEMNNVKHETIEQVNNGITRPLVYLATVDNNVVSALDRRPVMDEAFDAIKDTTLKEASQFSTNTASINKSGGKQSSKRKPGIVGSKLGLRKSTRSFLNSPIPKKSSISKTNRSLQGSSSKVSRKYVIRDIMVIPEEQAGQKFASVYPAQTLNNEIPDEAESTEREIRLHNLNNDIDEYEGNKRFGNSTQQKSTLNRNSCTNMNNDDGRSIPCIYYCSTSTVDTKIGNQNDNLGDHNTKYSDNQNTSQPENQNTIVIEPETHRELIKAIDASNGKARLISLPTKIYRNDSAGNRLSLGLNRPKGLRPPPMVEIIEEEDTRDDLKNNFLNRNVKPVQIVSTSATGNTDTDRSELFEIRRGVNHNLDKQGHIPERPVTVKDQRGYSTNILAYPGVLQTNNPLANKYDVNFGNDQTYSKGVRGQDTRRRSKGMRPTKTILSFSEPIIENESQNDFNNSGLVPAEIKKKCTRKSKDKPLPKNLYQTQDQMVYVGKLPNTTYNVFFAPDQPDNKFSQQVKRSSDYRKSSAREIRSETKQLGPIKSEKLIAQGPKAILIFVNKKTELNRNPFDGNVIYDDDDPYGKGKKSKSHRKHKGRDEDGKSRSGKSGISGKSGRSGKSGKGKSRRGSDFLVSSAMYDPGSRRTGEDGIIIEKSPSGLKTVTKYPCGCMKITKFDPEKGTSSTEVTSAFCQLGSKCEIGQSQKDKRLLRYAGDESASTRYTELPRLPQLDIVLEGIVSKKPIKPQEPAPQMRGANLTGTLTIKTNRCNGVFNFYIDPRLKQYLRNNMPCIANNKSYLSSR